MYYASAAILCQFFNKIRLNGYKSNIPIGWIGCTRHTESLMRPREHTKRQSLVKYTLLRNEIKVKPNYSKMIWNLTKTLTNELRSQTESHFLTNFDPHSGAAVRPVEFP